MIVEKDIVRADSLTTTNYTRASTLLIRDNCTVVAMEG